MQPDKEYRLKQIINQTHDRLLSVLLSFTKDRHLCEDLLQEAYVRLWENMDELQDDASAIFLLKRYTRNLFLDEMRKLTSREALLVKMKWEATEISVEDQAINKERYQAIQMAINKLPAQQRLIFQMHKEQAMSYRQIAEQLGIATGTIEKQMGRALKFLRQELAPLKTNDQAIAFVSIYYILTAGSLFA
ncbi:MAG: sigma-70 family RNA polymerase sigma factor [Bacteroidota bacterium]